MYFNKLNATLSVDSPIAPPAGKENLSLNSSQQGEELKWPWSSDRTEDSTIDLNSQQLGMQAA